MCFINLSNHSSEGWDENQRKEAEKYGPIVDIPFPAVSSKADEEEIAVMSDDLVKRVQDLSPAAVMCQGEYTLCFAVVRKLMDVGIPCLAACTERVAEEKKEADGSMTRVSVFRFARFRKFV